MKKCKRCLLLEAGEKASYKTVSDYIDNLDNSLKVDDCLLYTSDAADDNVRV